MKHKTHDNYKRKQKLDFYFMPMNLENFLATLMIYRLALYTWFTYILYTFIYIL